MTPLLELAARCEAATGPDRELDAAIAVATCGDEAAWIVTPLASSLFSHKPGWYETGDGKSHAAAHFTASIDAAMTLVPERHANDLSVGISPMSLDMGNRNWRAHVGGMRNRGNGISPALALCAAALRARAAAEQAA